MRGGKSERVRLCKEAMLRAGKTVVIASPEAVTKWRRVWRGGRCFDVAEDLKPMTGVALSTVWYDEISKIETSDK